MPQLFLRFPEGKTKALTLSYDDGVEQDIELIDIMNKYGLKGTFNLNSGLYAEEGTVYPKGQVHRRMTKNQILQTFKYSGQEIAAHSLTHPSLDKLPTNIIINEIIEDRKNLEEQFDIIVRGMAYPYGTVNDYVIDALKLCGIVYARTVISTLDFRIPKDFLRLTATCHHKCPELEYLSKKFIEDEVSGDPYLFYLWGHSYEFERDNNWDSIKNFANYVGNREDIWYATNIEIYDYIDAYNRLLFSTDGKIVKNPSSTKVWFKYSEKLLAIEAGETLDVLKK